jgi:hypothetical protein
VHPAGYIEEVIGRESHQFQPKSTIETITQKRLEKFHKIRHARRVPASITSVLHGPYPLNKFGSCPIYLIGQGLFFQEAVTGESLTEFPRK